MTLMVTSSAIHRMGLSDLFFFMIQLSWLEERHGPGRVWHIGW
jgi:hypothetical protein